MAIFPTPGSILNIRDLGKGYIVLNNPTRLVICFKLTGGGNPWIEETPGILNRLNRFEGVLQQLRIGEEVQIIVKRIPVKPDRYIDFFDKKISKDAPQEFRTRFPKYFKEWIKQWIKDEDLCRYESYLLFTIQEGNIPLLDSLIRRKTKDQNDDLNIDLVMDRARTWALGMTTLGLSAEVLKREEIYKLFIEEMNLSYDEGLANSILENPAFKVSGPTDATIKEQVAVTPIEFALDYFRVGKKFGRTFFFEEFPDSSQNPMFLAQLFTQRDAFKITLFFRGIDQAEAKKLVESRSLGDKGSAQKGNLDNEESIALFAHRKRVLQLHSTGATKFINFSLYVTLYNDNIKRLNQSSDDFLGRVGSFHRLNGYYEQQELFRSTLPQCFNIAKHEHLMATVDVSNSWPWFFDALTMGDGIPLGANVSREIVPIDPWARHLSNWNNVIVGQAGQGKTFWIQQFIVRHLSFGIRVMIVDQTKSYQFLCEAAGGAYIPIDLESDHHLNVFDMEVDVLVERKGDVPAKKASDVLAFLNVLLSEENEDRLDNLVTAHMDEAIKATYLKKFKKDPKNPIPILSDLKKTLLEFSEDEARPDEFQSLCRRYSKMLEPYTGSGSYANLTDRPTSLKEENVFTVFDLSGLPETETIASLGVFIASQFIKKQAFANKKKGYKTSCLLDEAWVLARFKAGVDFLLTMAKRSRHMALNSYFATQQVTDFLKSDDTKPIIANAACKFIFQPGSDEADILSRILTLTPAENHIIKGLRQLPGKFSQCFSVIGQKSRGLVYIIPDDVTYVLATTHPDEVFEREQFMKKHLEAGTGDKNDKDYVLAQKWNGIFEMVKKRMEEN